MTEYDVKEIIRKDREERGPGCFGAILILGCYAILFYVIHVAGEDYKATKDQVKQLQERVEQLEKKVK